MRVMDDHTIVIVHWMKMCQHVCVALGDGGITMQPHIQLTPSAYAREAERVRKLEALARAEQDEPSARRMRKLAGWLDALSAREQ